MNHVAITTPLLLDVGTRTTLHLGTPRAPEMHSTEVLCSLTPKPFISAMSYFVPWDLQGHRGKTGEGAESRFFSGTSAAASVIPLFFHFHNLTFPEVTRASWCGLNKRKTL